MIQRSLHYPAGWEWSRQLHPSDEHELQALKKAWPQIANWLDTLGTAVSRKSTHLKVTTTAAGAAALQGTLRFPASEAANDEQLLHFYVTEQQLLTLFQDVRPSLRLSRSPWEEQLHSSTHAVEALAVVMGMLAEAFHQGLEALQTQVDALALSPALTPLAKRGGTAEQQLEKLDAYKHQWLRWRQLFVALREVESAAKEAFMTQFADATATRRLGHQLQRVELRLAHSREQLDMLVSQEEIMRALRSKRLWKKAALFLAVCATLCALALILIVAVLVMNGNLQAFRFFHYSFEHF